MADADAGDARGASAQTSPLNAVFDVVRRAAVAAAPPPQATKSGSGEGDDGGELQIWSINLVYGELQPDAVAQLLEAGLNALLPDKRRGVVPRAAPAFLDLGSGEGVPCLTAAIRFGSRLGRICGIELLPRLHRAAVGHRAAMQGLLEGGGPDAFAAIGTGDGLDAALRAVARIELLCDSFLAPAPAPEAADGAAASVAAICSHGDGPGVALAAASVADHPPSDWPALFDFVFCNGTCFDEETLEDVYRRLDKLRPGAIVVLSTHKMPSPVFEVLFEGRFAASWGEVTARIYRKKQLPAWVAGVLGRTGATPATVPITAPARSAVAAAPPASTHSPSHPDSAAAEQAAVASAASASNTTQPAGAP